MATRVYLVRHGATRLTAEDRFAGAVDFRHPALARLMTFNDVSHYADLPRRGGEDPSPWWDASPGRGPTDG